MGTDDKPKLRIGWSSRPISDTDQSPERAWNEPSWTPPPADQDDLYPVTTVKLMPDYGVELPLWGAEWWELELTPQLLDALADWQEQFDIHFRPEAGWINADTATEWETRAEELVEAVKLQLAPSLEFEVDLWPIRGRRRRRRIERQQRRPLN